MRTACLECDLVISVPELSEGERSECPRCHRLVFEKVPDSLNRPLAYALAAICLLILSNSFSFITLQSKGLEKVMTLPHSIAELTESGNVLLALLVWAPIAGVPGLMLLAVVVLLAPLLLERPVSWLVPVARSIFALGHWAMVEVFIVGVLVSLVKIGTLATVSLGIAFWAYAAFTVCFIATFATLDRWEVWRTIERVRDMSPSANAWVANE